MFTGIVEHLATLIHKDFQGTNMTLTFQSELSSELAIDQSVAHNGICLTIIDIAPPYYKVTAIEETIKITNIGSWQINQLINTERALSVGDRLDGHWVQGHVDGTVEILDITPLDGSLDITLALDSTHKDLIVEKGSVCLQGISLTTHDVTSDSFKVSIIPYTATHTDISTWTIGQDINVEFDFFAKMIKRQLDLRFNS